MILQILVLRDLDPSVTSGQHIFLIDLVDNYLYLFDDLLVKKYFVFTPSESLGRKCRIQESDLSLSNTTSSSCVT